MYQNLFLRVGTILDQFHNEKEFPESKTLA